MSKTTYRVVNPVHETFYEGETWDDCCKWIESFATEITNPLCEPARALTGSATLT